jgi:wyosine [tRNA(Phe)-imidazoG37] synthetase (radical SAM superfamily)
MDLRYLLKEVGYYKKLGKGHLKRMITKFLLAKTPASKIVNTKVYNAIYSRRIKNLAEKVNPTMLQIENTNFCNAKCIMCPHTIMKRKAKTMTQNEFIKVCNGVLPFEPIKLVTITGFGEPFIDQGIIEKIKWLNDNYPRLDIDIYTNASLLDSRLTNELLKLKIHKINFSINGTASSYEKIMSLNYERTKENILRFLNQKKKLKKKYPLTNISLMIVKENENEIESVIKFWHRKTDSIMAYLPSDWAGSFKNSSIIDKTPFKKKRWPCFAPFGTIMVDCECNVLMCCRDYESKVKFGSLLQKNIRDIRNDKPFKELLKKQLSGNYNTPICSTCENVFDSSLNWW